jgi:hypothetical protein
VADFTPQQTKALQESLGRIAIEASTINLDGFLEMAEGVSSPQAVASGLSIDAITSAARWAELARLLMPFWELARELVNRIREDREGLDDDLAPTSCACPGCGELRIDMLGINDYESVDCATCGAHYQLPGGPAATDGDEQ